MSTDHQTTPAVGLRPPDGDVAESPAMRRRRRSREFQRMNGLTYDEAGRPVMPSQSALTAQVRKLLRR